MWLSCIEWCCWQLVYSVIQQCISTDWIGNLSHHVNPALITASCATLFHCLLHPLLCIRRHTEVKRDMASDMLHRLQVSETRHDHPSLSAAWRRAWQSLTRGCCVQKPWCVWPPCFLLWGNTCDWISPGVVFLGNHFLGHAHFCIILALDSEHIGIYEWQCCWHCAKMACLGLSGTLLLVGTKSFGSESISKSDHPRLPFCLA